MKCRDSARRPGDLSSISWLSGLDSMLSLTSVSFCLIPNYVVAIVSILLNVVVDVGVFLFNSVLSVVI